MAEIDVTQKNVLTIEDPVEYSLAGVSQVQVATKKGLTFASGLRSFLRQDPDVMMVGEIRDLETAEIAIRAALTGHLVFSTVHTNDAASTVTRIVDQGVEPYLVSSSLILVIAQRLVRTICPHCKTLVPINDEWHAKLKKLAASRPTKLEGEIASARAATSASTRATRAGRRSTSSCPSTRCCARRSWRERPRRRSSAPRSSGG